MSKDALAELIRWLDDTFANIPNHKPYDEADCKAMWIRDNKDKFLATLAMKRKFFVPCSHCGGTGVFEKVYREFSYTTKNICYICHGTGKVPIEEEISE